MVSLTLKHNIHWQAPMPLWAENSSTGLRVTNEALAPYPSILRFASDSFMQEMLDVMDHSPKRIAEWLVQAETWREPMKSPEAVVKKTQEDSIAFLLNKTRQLTDQYRSSATTKSVKPKQAVVVSENAKPDGSPVKLYQSTHQRYYLVSASLISSQAGYPDHLLDLPQREKATFVLRRLAPPDDWPGVAEGESIDNLGDWDEYAFIITTGGPRWKRVDQSKSLACKKLQKQEEQLPLFPVNYKDSCEHNRVVLNGLIPVGKREKWMSAPVAGSVAASDGSDEDSITSAGMSRARMLFQNDVTGPWKILVEQAEYTKQGLGRSISGFETSGSSAGETDRARRTQRDIIQMASWYVLLDFARFLQRNLPGLWNVATRMAANDSLQAADFDLGSNEIELLDLIQQTRLSNNVIDALLAENDQYVPDYDLDTVVRRNAAIDAGTVRPGLLNALVAISALESDLETVETEFVRFDDQGSSPVALSVDEKWPDFLFPLADPQFNGPVPGNASSSGSLDSRLEKIDALAELVEKILPEPADTETVVQPDAGLNQREAWFVIRCVYERPHCGPLFPALVSEPTRVFQMAPFFDPDAPSRPVRIPMPLDISPAGLRKYQKNTAFVISDMLCGKIKKIRKITLGDLVLSVLPWPFHKDLPNPGDTGPCKSGGMDIGMICSLSIPIVTLCALILLMIMVALFDLFFRWIPFLFICLPIPGLKGK